MFSRRNLLIVLTHAAALLPLAADELSDVILKARTHIGTEEQLKAVSSVRYIGTIEIFVPGQKKDEKGTPILEKTTAKVDAKYKQPWLQRVDLDFGNGKEARAINESGGWIRSESKDGRNSTDVMTPNTWKETRANSVENLLFYSVEGAPDAKSTYEGKVTFEGKPCQKVVTTYGPKIRYERYFHADTGKLYATVHEGNLVMKETGTVKTNNGLNFPATLETYREGILVNRFVFDKVEINLEMGPELFERPPLHYRLPR